MGGQSVYILPFLKHLQHLLGTFPWWPSYTKESTSPQAIHVSKHRRMCPSTFFFFPPSYLHLLPKQSAPTERLPMDTTVAKQPEVGVVSKCSQLRGKRNSFCFPSSLPPYPFPLSVCLLIYFSLFLSLSLSLTLSFAFFFSVCLGLFFARALSLRWHLLYFNDQRMTSWGTLSQAQETGSQTHSQ